MSRAASRYAKAILSIAQDKGVSTEVETDMETITSTFSGNAELTSFIQNPTIPVKAKSNAINEIFKATNGVTQDLFRLLLENKRFEILSEIASSYKMLFDDMNGYETAKVTTAVAMDKEMETMVRNKVLTFSNKKVVIENVVDPEIIGGFILRMGDQQYNASIANRLKTLKREMLN